MVNELNHSLIEDYLNKLNKKLQLLPKREREHQVSEIRDHIYHTIQEKTKAGMNINQAAKDTLQEFLSPEELAKAIINEEENKLLVNKGETLFNYGIMLTVGSLGGLSIPILRGELNLGIILPFVMSLIVGIILLNSKTIQWNENQLQNIKWISRIVIGFLGVPLTFFSIRIIKDNAINYASLSYLLVIIIVGLGIYLLLRKLFYNKQLNNY
ncbi:HAAS signaling domain-containing protein [Lysinibacillus piscis]|uniref:DUF1700 domain-containing protein n=1 Tax=Lysinibacillus piscis TaxID=2518931 RepID=A0ABQ5NJ47_9BACI|nr:DUF1129 family protein [Lysinibacillus sp. KH24]GLC88390.1 hypothetical protein LYSBPC_15170 [Lysinibacillus sp. KH24]